jgi:hypothetical protein
VQLTASTVRLHLAATAPLDGLSAVKVRVHLIGVGLASAGTLTTPGLDRGKSCVGLWGVSPRDGYLAHNTTQGTQENLPTVAEVTASIRA